MVYADAKSGDGEDDDDDAAAAVGAAFEITTAIEPQIYLNTLD